MDPVLVLLRLIHIVFGVFWAGSMFFVVSFLLPTARAVGPAAGPFMLRFARSPFLNAALASAVLTVLSGLALFWWLAEANSGFMSSPRGVTLGIGGVAAIVALGIGLGYQRPHGMRLAALAAEIQAGGGQPTEAQVAQLPIIQARMIRGGRWIATLLLVAVVCMAIARYI